MKIFHLHSQDYQLRPHLAEVLCGDCKDALTSGVVSLPPDAETEIHPAEHIEKCRSWVEKNKKKYIPSFRREHRVWTAVVCPYCGGLFSPEGESWELSASPVYPPGGSRVKMRPLPNNADRKAEHDDVHAKWQAKAAGR